MLGPILPISLRSVKPVKHSPHFMLIWFTARVEHVQTFVLARWGNYSVEQISDLVEQNIICHVTDYRFSGTEKNNFWNTVTKLRKYTKPRIYKYFCG